MRKTKQGQILKETILKTARSGGKGGQHVNKTSSKVMLYFDVNASNAMSDKEKIRISKKLENHIVQDKFILVSSEKERSQVRNRELAERKLIKLIEKGLRKQKKRKPTKPTKASKRKRLKNKKMQSEKKQRRKL